MVIFCVNPFILIKNLLKKIADVLGVTVAYLNSENENQDIRPQLTKSQYNELLGKIDETIKSYFDIVDDAK